ncbi:hypothetical protein AKJ45_03420 [candidate division MSBL1 archaeon SCGC-AAA261F19]|uniref:Uncharacterized protein n=1 Tax=candidate division MSBL1 archaeon SCGC-AAA261F19 TaxID=1698275 RepID=A0A133V832_9EURY|nr:hypothetical protein AKJ45_03420 [candidate division MSBL1 archaeon SCGC-AAA261F19]
MANEGEVLSQLSKFEATIYRMGEKAFAQHCKHCNWRTTSKSSKPLCTLTGGLCRFESCPKLSGEKPDESSELADWTS